MLEVFQENASFGLSFPGAQQSISFQSVLDQARDKQVETIRVEAFNLTTDPCLPKPCRSAS